jgi:hypothetical protein
MNAPHFLRSTLFGGAAVVLLGCGDSVAPAANAREPALEAQHLAAPKPPSGLVQCWPLPSASVSQTIGPAGGFLQVGPHLLAVPPGALVAPVRIKARAPSDNVNSIQFKPEGLIFQRPAYLTMSYANCGVTGVQFAKRIGVTSEDDLDEDDMEDLTFAPSADDLGGQGVTGVVKQFSTYALTW